MNDNTKTLCFVGAAVLALGASYIAKPTSAVYDVSEQLNKPLTETFEPEQAKRLTIVKFNEETATLREYEVAEEAGVWTIPSKGGYPADAQQQMAKAATGVVDRTILQIVSESAADHETLGVVDPKSPKLEVGQSGVGLRVTMSDDADKALADIIIGKPVKDTPNQHFVRRANQDVVYIVEIDEASFSTNFEDWIEDDLLKVGAWDLEQVKIKDYTAELELRGMQPSISWDRRGEFVLNYDADQSKWSAGELQEPAAETKELQPFQLGENQEINSEALNELKNALDDLRIVDVETKPAGLSGNLKAGGDFMKDNTAISSLVRRGFVPVPVEGQLDLLSSEGEVVVLMKDGVEYVLRFGNLKVLSEDDQAAAEPAADATTDLATGEEKEEADNGVSRYLFVMARFNPEAIESPQLEELPALPDEPAAPAAPEEAEEAEASAEKTAEDETEEDDKPAADSEEDSEADDVNEADDQAAEREEIVAQRKEIEQRNQRKLDEYNDQLEAGKQRVESLNNRFGDWYYVIADSVYKKIRLGREQLIKTKESEPAASKPDPNTSTLGAPGQALPGLPDLSTIEEEVEEEPTEKSSQEK